MNVDSHELYKKYKDVCLDINEYETLVRGGIIPKDFSNLYQGEITNFLVNKKVVDNIENIGTKLYLEDWYSIGNTFIPRSDNKGIFFFDNIIVITPEAEIKHERFNASSNLSVFGKPQKILPVAIPLHKIEKCEVVETQYTEYVELKFEGIERTFQINTGVGRDGRKKEIDNFSVRINARLLKNNAGSNIYTWSDNICKEIKKLVERCDSDYADRKKIVIGAIVDNPLATLLNDYVYLGQTEFFAAIYDNRERIFSTEKIEQIDVLFDQADEINNKNKLQEIYSKIANLDGEIATSILLKKAKLKKERESLIVELNDFLKIVKANRADLMKNLVVLFNQKDTAKREKLTPEEEMSAAVYEACIKRNITNLMDEESMQLFKLICNQQKVPKELQNTDFYEKGRTNYECKNNIENVSEINKKRATKILSYSREKENTKIIGYDKYLKKQLELYNQANGYSMASGALENLSRLQTNTKATKIDSAVMGGLASGLVGGGAGVMAYIDAEKRNQEAEVKAAETRQAAHNNMAMARSLGAAYSAEASRYKREIDRIIDKLCDTENTSQFFDYLDGSVSSYEVTDEGLMELDVIINLKKEPNIAGMDIVLDGSLKIDIIQNGNIVGDAYLCAVGFDETNLKKVGFNYKKQYKIIGVPQIGDFDKSKEYSFAFNPINIWMIEC